LKFSLYSEKQLIVSSSGKSTAAMTSTLLRAQGLSRRHRKTHPMYTVAGTVYETLGVVRPTNSLQELKRTT